MRNARCSRPSRRASTWGPRTRRCSRSTARRGSGRRGGAGGFGGAGGGGVDVYYEAAVCGSIPIIRVLREGLASDRVEALWGIVNGTPNYILSRRTSAARPLTAIL